jgi:DNA-3-methyladenine glycosylase II
MARLIARVGPCRMLAHPQDTFEALLQSITFQQLNGKAASTIHGRVVAVLGGKVTPQRLRAASDKALRGAGLSANKLAAMRDLAEKSLSGVVPRRRHLEPLPDAEIIERLTQVRGIGEWTAQMFLMFRLGRPDVLPIGDFGVRKSFGTFYRKSGRMPPPSALEKHGRIWAPYRTVASWYLWRALDGPAAV